VSQAGARREKCEGSAGSKAARAETTETNSAPVDIMLKHYGCTL
jgi:hypothetical protein